MNELSLIALALSIFWIFGLGSIAAIWLGRRALREIDASGGEESGRAMAWTAIGASAFGLTSTGLVAAVWIAS